MVEYEWEGCLEQNIKYPNKALFIDLSRCLDIFNYKWFNNMEFWKNLMYLTVKELLPWKCGVNRNVFPS
jgi:hypothetical protein